MTKNNKLAKAITLALSSGALALSVAQSAAASTTMYNLYNASLEPRASDGPAYPSAGSQIWGSDGWMWGGPGYASGGNPYAADPGWLGTDPNSAYAPLSSYAPFGTTTAMAVNWAAHITQAGDSLEISPAEAVARFGPALLLQEFGEIIYPDIDTSGGAWYASEHGVGRRHTIDIGLFKSDIAQNISLSIAGLTHDNFGITVYTGLSNNDFYYSHHGHYLGSSQQPFEGLPYLTHTPRDPITGLTSNSLTFTAEAGQIYTILLGGNGEDWYSAYDGYVLSIQTSPVPLPGAVWLFGSALVGFVGVQRKKTLLDDSKHHASC